MTRRKSSAARIGIALISFPHPLSGCRAGSKTITGLNWRANCTHHKLRKEKGGASRTEKAMNPKLKVGDRVRLVRRNWMPDCYSGDKGTVRSGPHSSSSGTVYYLLAMDRDVTGGAFLFTAKEVESEQSNESPDPTRGRSPEGKQWMDPSENMS
jgi:hypothetical protein